MTASTVPTAPAEPVPRRWTDRLPTLTAVWASVHALLGVWWLLEPAAWPFHRDDGPSALMSFVDPRLGAWLFTGTAFAGLVTALAMRRPHVAAGVRGLLLAVAVVQAALFTVVVPDARAITVLGYLMAFATPIGILTLAVVGSVRHWQIRILALAIVAVGVAAIVSGWASTGIVTEIVTGVAGGFARNGLGPWHVLAILAGGVAWTGMAVRYHRQGKGRCLPCGRPGARWTHPDAAARWGRWVTIAAILCPLPYGLLRMTWLTPWPVGFDAGELAADPGIRLFGVFLGCGALVGAVLTSGLISRWGERWPFWMPVLAGRPIPPLVAVIPATVVTCSLFAAGQSFTVIALSSLAKGDTESLWLYGAIPFGPWAALLALATLAYYYRRRGRCTSCRQQ